MPLCLGVVNVRSPPTKQLHVKLLCCSSRGLLAEVSTMSP